MLVPANRTSCRDSDPVGLPASLHPTGEEHGERAEKTGAARFAGVTRDSDNEQDIAELAMSWTQWHLPQASYPLIPPFNRSESSIPQAIFPGTC
jgi:hypothetical protein